MGLNHDRLSSGKSLYLAKIAARDLLNRAETAAAELATGEVSESDIAVEVSVEVEQLEDDCAGNVSRGVDPAIEYGWVADIKLHLKSWGY